MSIRIIGGSLKGHIIKSPKTISTRPILARVRKSLFDILKPYIQDAFFCDFFAGSGSVGIEAISRGAKQVVFVDNSKKVCKCIANNVKYCKIEKYSIICSQDVFDYIEHSLRKNDIIFIGPPYPLYIGEDLLKALSKSKIIKSSTRLILQHFFKEKMPYRIGKFICYRSEKYGDTKLSFYYVSEKD